MTDPKRVSNEQALPGTYDPEKAEKEQENYPEDGNESQTGAETDNSDLETEPADDGDSDL